MPNWCYNTAIFTNEDTTKVDALEKFLEKNELDDKEEESLFSFFLPCPEEQKKDWYTWNINNWGCKWDASIQSFERTSDEEITVTFETPWAPPVVLYKHLTQETDWYPTAYYLEEGMAFVGYVDGDSEEYYEYSDVASLNSIPEHIVDYWNLREQLEEYEEEEEFDEEGVELTLDPEFDKKLQELKDELDAIPIPTENTLKFDDKKSKNWLVNLLRESSVTITFIKKDGSERKMYCTLSEKKIPAEKTPKGTEKSKNEEVLPVFDLESGGWRSFRWDSVKRIDFDLTESE